MQLWRIESWTLEHVQRPHKLVAGLRLHLAHARLTTIEVRIGEGRRTYLGPSCAGCNANRCVPGCHGDLLRRLLRTSAPDATLTPVDGELAPRAYTRACLARPLPSAQAIRLPSAGVEARLVIAYQKRATVALLLVGADGPDPVAHARAADWQAWPLPTQLLRWAAITMQPPIIFSGKLHVPSLFDVVLPSDAETEQAPPKRWSYLYSRLPRLSLVPFRDRRTNKPLLLPSNDPESVAVDRQEKESEAPSFLTPASDDLPAEWLHGVLHDPEAVLRATGSAARAKSAAESAAARSPERAGWPSGPNGMSAEVLAELVAQILAEPTFVSTRKGQSGISKGRLVGLRHSRIDDEMARALIVWFDQAGVLVAPEDNQSRWRAPRVLVTNNLDELAAKLRVTPLPSRDAVRAAFGGS